MVIRYSRAGQQSGRLCSGLILHIHRKVNGTRPWDVIIVWRWKSTTIAACFHIINWTRSFRVPTSDFSECCPSRDTEQNVLLCRTTDLGNIIPGITKAIFLLTDRCIQRLWRIFCLCLTNTTRKLCFRLVQSNYSHPVLGCFGVQTNHKTHFLVSSCGKHPSTWS